MTRSAALIIPAAGLGTRMGQRKALMPLDDRPIIVHTLERFLPLAERLGAVVVVAHPDDIDQAERVLEPLGGGFGSLAVVPGGARRQDSVRAGLEAAPPDLELVAIHDAVRPFVSPSTVAAALETAAQVGAAIVAAPMKPTVKRVEEGRVVATLDRQRLWCAQTPQVFRRHLLLAAWQAAERDGLEVTDDAQLLEHIGHPVAVVPGSDLNIKITTPEDLALARAILAAGLLPDR